VEIIYFSIANCKVVSIVVVLHCIFALFFGHDIEGMALEQFLSKMCNNLFYAKHQTRVRFPLPVEEKNSKTGIHSFSA